MSKQECKGTDYRFATIAVLAERGGRVSTASTFTLCGLGIARVGDVVTYPDGAKRSSLMAQATPLRLTTAQPHLSVRI